MMNKTINLFKLVRPAYWPLITVLMNMLKGKKVNSKEIPITFTVGGSRASGKTRAIFIVFAILFALMHKRSFILIEVKKSEDKNNIWKTLNDFIDNLLMVRNKIKRSTQQPMDFEFHNGSIISVRSLTTKDSKEVALKGLPRLTGLKKAVIINEECNTWPKKWFSVADEAIVADEIYTINIFNTDHIKQYIVGELQKHLPENESIMKEIGNMMVIKKVNGVWNYFQRTNTLVTWDVLPKVKRTKIIAADMDDSQRGRVARWGLNGRDGKLLYYNLKDRHFIKSDNFTAYNHLYTLPFQLFVKYRIGLDEGSQNDTFVVSLWGVTRENRGVWIGGKSYVPPENGELNITEVSKDVSEKIKLWARMYRNFPRVRVAIRVETAGNGTAVRQELMRELQRTNINYTIDKAKKSIDGKTKKTVGSTKSTQPELEARAAIKNLLFGRNQLLFWNAPDEIIQEYFGRGRDEEGRITDGDDHWGDGDDYALIPEYKKMIDNPPKKTFSEELDWVMDRYALNK